MQNKEIEQLKNKQFHLDLVEIEIWNTKHKFTGKGSVHQDEDGKLVLKVYCNEKSKQAGLRVLDLLTSGKVGKLVSKDEYFQLEARDLSDNIWKAEHFIVYTQTGVEGSIVLNAKLYEMSYTNELPKDLKTGNASCFFIFPFNYKYPYNISTKTHEEVAGRSSSSVNLNAAKYDSKESGVLIKENGKFLDIFINSTSVRVPPTIDLRITEVLQYILAVKMNWIYFQKTEEGMQTFYIRSFTPIGKKGLFMPPIGVGNVDFDRHIKELFEVYFNYIWDFSEERYHILSSFIVSLIQSSQESIEEFGLALSVSVEGVLNSEFQNLVPTQAITEKDKKEVRVWLESAKISTNMIQRLNNFIEKVDEVRPVDKLYYMSKQGLISEDLIKAWKNLRNPAAHPNRKKSLQIDKYKNLIDKTLTLFHQLLFLQIGYTGMYTDYSAEGWIKKKFDKELIIP